MLRRLLSILLFAATLLPLVAPMLSTGAMAESTLPACCRRNGKHHCAMSSEQSALLMGEDSKGARVAAPVERCPYRQTSSTAVHLQSFTPEISAERSSGLLQEPSIAAQAECLRRISFDRSRQKRGPPSHS